MVAWNLKPKPKKQQKTAKINNKKKKVENKFTKFGFKKNFPLYTQSMRAMAMRMNQRMRNVIQQKFERRIRYNKTIERNRTDETIEQFCVYILKDSEILLKWNKIFLINNWLIMFQMVLYHVLVVALPLLPRLLLPSLIALELVFYLFTIIPFLCVAKFISWFRLFVRTLRFIFFEGFLICCLYLCIQSNNVIKPLDYDIQIYAIILISLGIALEYMALFVHLILRVKYAIYEFLLNERNPEDAIVIYTDLQRREKEKGCKSKLSQRVVSRELKSKVKMKPKMKPKFRPESIKNLIRGHRRSQDVIEGSPLKNWIHRSNEEELHLDFRSKIDARKNQGLGRDEHVLSSGRSLIGSGGFREPSKLFRTPNKLGVKTMKSVRNMPKKAFENRKNPRRNRKRSRMMRSSIDEL